MKTAGFGSVVFLGLLAGCGGSAMETHFLGGSISGLTAGGLVLQNNGGDNLNLGANASTFRFGTELVAGTKYAVTILIQPTGLRCNVVNDTGTMGGRDVTNVAVACVSSGSGSLDTTFNGSGFVATTGTAGGTLDFGKAVVIDARDNIVVAGSSNCGDTAGTSANCFMALWRYTSDGIPDPTFHGTGSTTVTGTGGGSNDYAEAVALDQQKNIVVTGMGDNLYASHIGDLAIWRYTPSGDLDTTLNGTGFLTKAGTVGGTRDHATSVALDGQGRIVVAGGSLDATGAWHMAIWRYSGTGSLDSTFNSTGFVSMAGTAGGGNLDYAYSVALDNQDNIVAAGISRDASGTCFLALWRYTSSGTLDTTFNGTGFVTKTGTSGGNNDDGSAVMLDSQGKIVVAGYSVDASNNWYVAVWRFTNTGSPDTSFNGTGYVLKTGTSGANDDTGSAVALDSHGNIVVAGASADASSNSYVAVWRYTSAGILDISFNGTGYVTQASAASGTSAWGAGMALDSLGRIVVAGITDYDNNASGSLGVWRFNP